MQNSRRSFAIIGVVGRTISKEPLPEEPKLVRVAREVGAAITRKHHAVLTGGHHERKEASVKYGALQGAIDEAMYCSSSRPARLIGIVPKDISVNLKSPVKGEKVVTYAAQDDPIRHLYVHTALPSEERDKITGQTADVFIALEGQSGTPREIAAAINEGRPVIFLNSLTVLKPLVIKELERSKSKALFPSNPVQASSPAEAVTKALEAIAWNSPSPQLKGLCPMRQTDFAQGLQVIS